MPVPMSSAVLQSAITDPSTWGPALEGAVLRGDGAEFSLRITARRLLPIRPDDLYALWTRRTGWDAWLRLRARSRATLEAYRGGHFRLELAEGPTIHVITGAFEDVVYPEWLTLSWRREGGCNAPSRVDVRFQPHHQHTELTLCHSGIASRREASWLMRVWTSALGRLEVYVRTDDIDGQRRRAARQRRSDRARAMRGPASHIPSATAPFGHVISLP